MSDFPTAPSSIDGDIRWGPDNAKCIIIALHGLNDYAMSFDAAAEAWAKRGICTYALNQQGFGVHQSPRWPGDMVLVRDVHSVMERVRAHHSGVPICLLGESIGAAVAVLATTIDDGIPPAGLILSAPAIRPKNAIPLYQRAAGWFIARFIPNLTVSRNIMASDATDNIAQLRKMNDDANISDHIRLATFVGVGRLMAAAYLRLFRVTVPTLILRGERDKIIPPVDISRVFNALSKSQSDVDLINYPAGYHLLFRDLQAQKVIDDVGIWIERAILCEDYTNNSRR